jgi:hypothetical protein
MHTAPYLLKLSGFNHSHRPSFQAGPEKSPISWTGFKGTPECPWINLEPLKNEVFQGQLFIAQVLLQAFSLFHMIRTYFGTTDCYHNSADPESLSDIMGKASHVKPRRHLASEGEIGELELLQF